MKTLLRASLPIVAVVVVGCKPAQPSAEYLAVCEGPPLGTTERREQAAQEGYEINRRYDCATKQSVKFMAEQKARWEAANTPEAKAARQAEFDQRKAEYNSRIEARATAEAEARTEREQRWAAAEAAPVPAVEINSATELQLADLQGLGADVARQIVVERTRGAFTGWDDVVRRVPALAAAEAAVRASAFGLTVDGRSLEGAEPQSPMARFARDKWRRRNG